MYDLEREMDAKGEMQMKKASEDVESVRARKGSIERGGIQS